MSLGLRRRHGLRIEVEAVGLNALGPRQIQKTSVATSQIHAIARTGSDGQVDRMEKRRTIARIVPSHLGLQVGVESPIARQHRIKKLEPAGHTPVLSHPRRTLERGLCLRTEGHAEVVPQTTDLIGREGIDLGGPLMAAQQAGNRLGHDLVQHNRSRVTASILPVAFNGDPRGIGRAFHR